MPLVNASSPSRMRSRPSKRDRSSSASPMRWSRSRGEHAGRHVGEVHSGDWGIGGKPLSTEDVQALSAGTPA
jgi:hypothetical protein